jgi:hypothetical protein
VQSTIIPTQSSLILPISRHAWRGDAFHHIGEDEAALIDYNEAIILYPDDLSFYFERAKVRANTGDQIGALGDFQTVVDLYRKSTNIGGRGADDYYEAVHSIAVIEQQLRKSK